MAPRFCALAALMGRMALAEDTIALVQQTVSPHTEASSVQRLLEEHKDVLSTAPDLTNLVRELTPSSYVGAAVEGSKRSSGKSKSALSKAWHKFYETSHRSNTADPQELLANAKVALLETGAMQEMRQMALATANSSSSTKGAVPLDSMMVGFRTSVAPWNNLLRMFAMPLVKASFTIFTNFFGPQGNAARLCLGASVAADSTYGVHTRSEFGGINVWLGPAKWDNVPGWSFGTSGGIDDVRVWDVADFGWSWTLAKVPETVGFHWDVLVIDDETIHAGMLQTDSKVSAEKTKAIPRHGSTWLQHVWCSPHWENTPLVIPDEAPASAATQMYAVKKEPAAAPVKLEESYDPESEAV